MNRGTSGELFKNGYVTREKKRERKDETRRMYKLTGDRKNGVNQWI